MMQHLGCFTVANCVHVFACCFITGSSKTGPSQAATAAAASSVTFVSVLLAAAAASVYYYKRQQAAAAARILPHLSFETAPDSDQADMASSGGDDPENREDAPGNTSAADHGDTQVRLKG